MAILGVKIVKTSPVHDSKVTPTKPKIDYQMRSPEDAEVLANAIQKLHRIPIRESCQQTPHGPSIGVLNRMPQSRRSMLNVDAIADALRNRFNHSSNISVAYFEHADYVDQVRFFAETDIVVSPHGAQLTGLFLLPLCGRVLEVFPHHFYIPAFFRSLADCTGHPHYAMYLTNDTDNSMTTFPRIKNLKSARSSQLCPPPDNVVQALQNVIQDWYQCCRNAYNKG